MPCAGAICDEVTRPRGGTLGSSVDLPQIADDTSLDAPVPVETRIERRHRLRGRERSGIAAITEWVLIVSAALAVALFIKAFVLQAFYIPSGSMERTLMISDRVLVNKLSYRMHDVHRGDIVVFERPAGEDDPRVHDLIKRVIALPGETVESRDGRILINGRALDEPYLADAHETTGVEVTHIPPNHLWVMGDNRTNSKDSRSFGAIPDRLIVGRAFVRLWPISHIHLL
jgi:signal peptidase I